MEALANLFGVALLPVAGMLLGALAGEWARLKPYGMGVVLHAAAGVAIAVVSVELMPRIIADIEPWQLVAGFLLGAAASVVMIKGVHRASRRFGLARQGAWRVYLPVAVDLAGDGLMVGIGSAVSGGLGFLLGLSQVIANIPGGFAATTDLKSNEVSRTVRRVAMLLLVLPVLLGAGLGYWLLRDLSPSMQNAGLAFIAGMLLLATVEDLVPEADEPDARRSLTTSAFAGGFVFFALLSLYLG